MALFDFEALRAERNANVVQRTQKLAEEWGVAPERLLGSFNPAACYCACSTGGPCEHKWDGPDWESDDSCAVSVTCSRCGTTAMSHDMRCLP